MEYIEFVYNSKESRFSNLECYDVYDLKLNDFMYDNKAEKMSIAINREAKLIYFLHMDAGEHYILEKMVHFKIIQKFLSQAKEYDCENFTVYKDCTGGEIYYKYN